MTAFVRPPFRFNGGAYNIPFAALLSTTGGLTITHTTSATHSGFARVCKFRDGVVQPILGTSIYFNASNQLVINGITSTAVYRDKTWYNIFWNAAGAWVFGTAVTGTGSYATAAIVNPKWGYDGTNYSAMSLAECVLWDGTSEPLNGIALDAYTPNYVYKAPASTPHTYLKFENSVTMGTNSGTGGAYTVVGGVTQDESTPTNVYATPNPLDINVSGGRAFSNGNRTITYVPSSWYDGVRGSFLLEHSVPTYWEQTTTLVSGTVLFGFANSSWNLYQGYASASANVWTFENHPSLGFNLNANGTSIGWQTGYSNLSASVLKCARNGDKFWLGIDNIWFDSTGGTTGNPSTGTNPTFTIVGSSAMRIMPMWNAGAACSITTRFTDSQWTKPCPTGFKSLCTDNMPARSPKVPSTPQTGSFTGNANADGPFVNLGMAPDKAGVSTINGNAITWGTHADACATGFKLRTSSASYNTAGANTYSIAVQAYTGGSNIAEANGMVNP